MMMKRFWWILLLVPSLLRAQSDGHKLTVDANFMTRGEIRSGGLSSEQGEGEMDRAAFLLGRSRLGANYTHKGLSAQLTAQHSGVWGDNGSFSLYEGWVQFTTKPGFFAKVGRQNLIYDDERIFGSDDWSMAGMSHDVLKLGYEGHGHKVHLFAAYNQTADNITGGSFYSGGSQPYKAMEAIWYHFDMPAWNLGASAVFMNVGIQGGSPVQENEKTFQQQLAGAYLTFKPKGWAVEGAYYRQMGKAEGDVPIDAWMASFKTTATPSTALQAYIGFDYLSGDPDFAIPPQGMIGMTHHDVIRGFNSIFGSHHKFYGAMDFFYVTTYVGGFTPGLQNAYVGARWLPVPSLTLDASYHFLAVATRLEDAKKPLGHELEFATSWSFMKGARLGLGYSYMRGTETMEMLKRVTGNRTLHWGWVMLTVNPRLQVGGPGKKED